MKKIGYIIIATWLLVIGVFLLVDKLKFISSYDVYIKTSPVDPYDLIRGHYVDLNYEITRLDKKTDKTIGDTCYIQLTIDENNIAAQKNITFEKPESGLFLKGKLDRHNTECSVKNIKHYFTSAAKAKRFERIQSPIFAKIKISKQGDARIIDLKAVQID